MRYFKNVHVEILSMMNHYPLEETFKPEFMVQVKTAEKDIANGKCLEFESMDDFLGSVEE